MACRVVSIRRTEDSQKKITNLADADSDRLVLEVLIERDQEPRIHGGGEEVQHPVIFVKND